MSTLGQYGIELSMGLLRQTQVVRLQFVIYCFIQEFQSQSEEIETKNTEGRLVVKG